MTRTNRHRRNEKRRATVMVLVAISLVFIVGFTALTLDLGTLLVARTQLQAAADAAALAGASAIFSDEGLAMKNRKLFNLAAERAIGIAELNKALGEPTSLEITDVIVGTHDFANPSAPLVVSGGQRYNAVQVMIRRTPESVNGSIGFFFAGIFGKQQGGVVASARAVADDRFAGLQYSGNLLPFTIHVDLYEDMATTGPDEFSYADGVVQAPDGVGEVQLFPFKSSPGNFGILNVGPYNSSSGSIENQVLNGISVSDLEQEIGTSELIYTDEFGNPVTYDMGGTPGMKSSIADALYTRLGDVIGFFVHDAVTDGGSNTVFRNVGVRFGRVMLIDLSGNDDDKRLVVQPVAVTGREIIIREGAESSAGQLGRLRLVR